MKAIAESIAAAIFACFVFPMLFLMLLGSLALAWILSLGSPGGRK